MRGNATGSCSEPTTFPEQWRFGEEATRRERAPLERLANATVALGQGEAGCLAKEPLPRPAGQLNSEVRGAGRQEFERLNTALLRKDQFQKNIDSLLDASFIGLLRDLKLKQRVNLRRCGFIEKFTALVGDEAFLQSF